MSQDEVERFLGKVALDSDFSKAAVKSLKNAILEAGIDISPGEMRCLRRTKFHKFAGAAVVDKYRFYMQIVR